jgi:hypothetical protein
MDTLLVNEIDMQPDCFEGEASTCLVAMFGIMTLLIVVDHRISSSSLVLTLWCTQSMLPP